MKAHDKSVDSTQPSTGQKDWTVFAVAILLVAAVILLLAVAGSVWVVREINRQETLPTQTSPDGQWSISITGKWKVFGAVEVVVIAEDQSGRVRGPYVAGVASDFEEFRRKYSNVKFSGDATWIDGQPFVLRPGVNRWPPGP